MPHRIRLSLILSLTLLPGVLAHGESPPARGKGTSAAIQADAGGRGDPLPPGVVRRLGTTRFRHPHPVEAIAYSPDGKLLASGGDFDDRSVVCLWDAATGRLVRQWRGRAGHLAFTPDGKALATAAPYGDVILWDVSSGRSLHRYPHPDGVDWAGIVLSPDGRHLFAAQRDGPIRRWEAATGKTLPKIAARRLKGPIPWQAIALSPDGKTLLSACDDGTVNLWDVSTGRRLRQLRGKGGHPAAAFSADGKWMTAGSEDGVVRLWDAATGKERRLGGPGPAVDTVCFTPDGKTLATVSEKALRLWDVATGKERRRPALWRPRTPWRLAFAPDGKTLAGADHACAIRFWDLASGRERAPGGHEGSVTALAFSPDGRQLWSGSATYHYGAGVDNSWRLWETATGNEVCRGCLPDGEDAAAFTFSPRTRLAAAAGSGSVGDGGFVRLWEADTGKELRRTEEDHIHSLCAVALSPDGRLVAAMAAPRAHEQPGDEFRVREVRTGKLVAAFKTKQDTSSPLFTFSPDGRFLTYRASDGRIRLWAAATRKPARAFGGNGIGFHALAFSPDGRLLAAACDWDEGRVHGVRVWDVATGKERRCFRVPFQGDWDANDAEPYVAFSPDGRTLAVGPVGDGLALYEVSTGGLRRRCAGHRGRVVSAAFSPSGRVLATGGEDCIVCLWDLAKGPGGGTRAVNPQARWRELTGDDAGKAYEAVWDLAAWPRQAVGLLRRHLRPVPEPPEARVGRLIAELDAEEFPVRERATRELGRLGDVVEPALRRALARKPSLELRRRLERVLAGLAEPPGPERIGPLRALEVLEHAGGDEARALLRELAGGAAGARLTREAKAALERLASRAAPTR